MLFIPLLASALPLSNAQAWWGGPGWGGGPWGYHNPWGYYNWTDGLGDLIGDLWGDVDFRVHFSLYGHGRGRGRGHGYGDYYGYGHYGYPGYWGGYHANYGSYPGYAMPYAQPPVITAAVSHMMFSDAVQVERPDCKSANGFGADQHSKCMNYISSSWSMLSDD